MPASGNLPSQARFTDGKIRLVSGTSVITRSADDGSLISSQSGFTGTSGIVRFDSRTGALYTPTSGSGIEQWLPGRSSDDSALLGDVVTSLCERVGLSAADLDVTELTDEVHGFGIARQISVRGALEMLAAAYSFDAVESDHQLKFKKRGRSPSRVIPEQDLVPVNAEREAFIETRAQEVDLPARFTVVYQDLERDADIGTQYAKRVAGPSSAMHSQNEATFDLPLMLTAAEAKGIALRQLHSAWLERTGYEWRLPWTHVDLEPADAVQVALDDGTLLNVRILETELGANLELAWKTVLEESSSYTVTAVPGGGLNYLPQVDPVSSEARLFLLDVPLIRDSDDALARRDRALLGGCRLLRPALARRGPVLERRWCCVRGGRRDPRCGGLGRRPDGAARHRSAVPDRSDQPAAPHHGERQPRLGQQSRDAERRQSGGADPRRRQRRAHPVPGHRAL